MLQSNLWNNLFVAALVLLCFVIYLFITTRFKKKPPTPADHWRDLAEYDLNKLVAEIKEASSLSEVFRLREKIKAFDDKFGGKVDAKMLLYMILGLYEELMRRCEFAELDFFS